MDWIHLTQDRDKWRACDLSNEPLVLQNAGNFLTIDLLPSQDGLCSMLVGWLVGWLV